MNVEPKLQMMLKVIEGTPWGFYSVDPRMHNKIMPEVQAGMNKAKAKGQGKLNALVYASKKLDRANDTCIALLVVVDNLGKFVYASLIGVTAHRTYTVGTMAEWNTLSGLNNGFSTRVSCTFSCYSATFGCYNPEQSMGKQKLVNF